MRIDPAPVVVGATATLRPLTADDVDAWFAYLSLPGHVAHTSWAVSDPSELASIVDACATDRGDSPIRFAIVDPHDDTLMGTIGFPVISWHHRTAEIAYDLGPAFDGRGTATACCRALTEWLLRDRGFHRVQATALDTNLASQRVLAKCGFAREGVLASLKTVRGELRDFHLFAKTRAG